MLVYNKSKSHIGWKLKGGNMREPLLVPGHNDIDESKLTKMELALIRALIKDRICEEVEAPPKSGRLPIADVASEPAERPMKVRRTRRRASRKKATA